MTDALAIIAGKLSAKAIRAAGAGMASNVPGRVSLAISPKVLANLARQARLGVIAVSGTNGKSTTSGFISAILHHCGFKIAHNKQGANLVPGITSSVIDAARWNGRLDVDYCLFETDEAALPLVAQDVNIDTIVVTNLFRDQLDRFGELDTTRNLINKGIGVNHSKAILNADDPNVAQLSGYREHLYYGIESAAVVEAGSQTTGGVQELAYCHKCGSEYSYDQFFYGQLGHYYCQQCGNRRPAPQVFAKDVKLSARGSEFKLSFNGLETPVHLALPGLFNVYNALAAAALAISLGIASDKFATALKSYSTLFGRSERLSLGGKSVLIQLIKNPAGASQAVRAAMNDPSARILIAINDNYADGRDVSWLWDAEFEALSNYQKPLIVAGIRAHDMAVRAKYCGIPPENIIVVGALAGALDLALASTTPEETLWILPTYTCLLELQKIMRALGQTLAGT